MFKDIMIIISKRVSVHHLKLNIREDTIYLKQLKKNDEEI